ncbi:TolC family protein [Nitratifractor sp.]
MLKRVPILLVLVASLEATSVEALLQGVRQSYKNRMGQLEVRRSDLALQTVRAQFYPKIHIFGSLTHYNTPSNFRPVTPTENAHSALDLPFSQNIARIGANLSMPIFVSSLFALSDKASAMRSSARAKHRLDLLKDEATVLGANANLRYLEALESALLSKRRTLKATEKIVRLQVQQGRAPASALLKVTERIGQLGISLDNVRIQKENVVALVESLSGLRPGRSAPMRRIGRLREGPIAALQPLKAKLRADELEATAQQRKLYPSLRLDAQVNRGYGESYLSGRSVQRDYGSVGLTLSAPLLDLPQVRSVEKARVESLRSAAQLEQTARELRAQVRSLQNGIGLLRHSIALGERTVEARRKLLAIARKSYEEGRMSLEEYLRYIDALFEARASLAQARAKAWQNLFQLAVIYGNPLDKLVR